MHVRGERGREDKSASRLNGRRGHGATLWIRCTIAANMFCTWELFLTECVSTESGPFANSSSSSLSSADGSPPLASLSSMVWLDIERVWSERRGARNGLESLKMAKIRVAAPSEMMISDKWDSLFEQLVIKTGIGAAVGFALSSVLFGANRPRGRIGLGMFAAGIGSGMAWERAAKEFEK